MASDSSRGGGSGGLPEVVAQAYYRYGLLVATHPIKVILLATATFLTLSSPLYYLPLPGYLPQEYMTAEHNYSIPPPAEGGIMLSPSPTPTPLWYQGAPIAYILQVVVRSSVGPIVSGTPQTRLTVSDSYRGPLSTVFDLHQTLSNYQLSLHHPTTGYFNSSFGAVEDERANKIGSFSDPHSTDHGGRLANNSSKKHHDGHKGVLWLGNQCLLVEDVVKKHRREGGAGGLLPHFNCLLLSPADLWTRDKNEFLRDPHVLTTVKSLMASYEGQSKVADILFGVPSAEVGLLQKVHPKVITYALTLALRTYNESFINGLRMELTRRYPLHQENQPRLHEITHLYFPYRLSLWEVLIFLLYCCLFFSICFSLRKIEILNSKIGISITVLVTLISSLCLAVGTCAYWGLKPLHSQGKYVYPVLAGLVGFENSMVLIRCVASTPNHLDVKIRVARGLAREGWTITKYFLSMITLVTLSFFLFIPIVQEICIYGSLVLLCDLYMQLVFLTAVLSIDLQRCHDSNKHIKQEMLLSTGWVNSSRYGSGGSRHGSIRTLNSDLNSATRTGIPNLHRRHAVVKTSVGEDRVAPPSSVPTKAESGIPKRLRITYFVTSKRMFQRMIMCVFVGWIAWIVYTTSGLFDHWEHVTNHGPGLALVINRIKTKSSDYQNHFHETENDFVEQHQRENSDDNVDGRIGSGGEIFTHPKYRGDHLSTETLDRSGKKRVNYDKTLNSFPKTLHLQNKTIFFDSAVTAKDESSLPSVVSSPREIPSSPGTFDHLRHRNPDLAEFLPETHWPTLFSYYNITLRGQYISLLPPVLLSVPVSIEEALAIQYPSDSNDGPWIPPHEPDPNDGSDSEGWWVNLMSGDSAASSSTGVNTTSNSLLLEDSRSGARNRGTRYGRRTPFIPSSSGEMIVTAILAIPAVGVMVYATVWLYRCVCSRHYAEWREQWWAGEKAEARAQIIGECVPVTLTGHAAEVECVCTDGAVVASACLAGTIRVWDPVTSECITAIDRTPANRFCQASYSDELNSDYGSGSPKSQADSPIYAHQSPGSIWYQHNSQELDDNQELSDLRQASASPTYRRFAAFTNLTPTIRTDFSLLYPDASTGSAKGIPVEGSDRWFSTEFGPSLGVRSTSNDAKGGGDDLRQLHDQPNQGRHRRTPSLDDCHNQRGFSSQPLFESQKRHQSLQFSDSVMNSSVQLNSRESLQNVVEKIGRSGTPSEGMRRNFSSESLMMPRKSSLDSLSNSDETKQQYSHLFQFEHVLHEQPNTRYHQANSSSNTLALQRQHNELRNSDRQHQLPSLPQRQRHLPTSHNPFRKTHRRNLSAGNAPLFVDGVSPTARCGMGNSRMPPTAGRRGLPPDGGGSSLPPDEECSGQPSSVWSLQCQDGLVMAGCADGRIEVYDAYSGKLKCVSCDSRGVGATSMSVSGNRLVVARLSGAVDLYTVHVANSSYDVTHPHHNAAAPHTTLAAVRSSNQSETADKRDLGSSHSAIDLSRSYFSNLTAMVVEGPASPKIVTTAGDGGAVIGSTNGRDVSRASFAAGGASSVSFEGAHRRTSSTTTANNSKTHRRGNSTDSQRFSMPSASIASLQQPHHLYQQQQLQPPSQYSTPGHTSTTPPLRVPDINNRRPDHTTSPSANYCVNEPPSNTSFTPFPSYPNNYAGATSFQQATNGHSSPSGVGTDDDGDSYDVWLVRDVTSKAHHQPISVLCCDRSRVLTGSLDHTLKVLNLFDGSCIFTLHGHLGPVTTATIGGPAGEAQQEGDAVLHMGPFDDTKDFDLPQSEARLRHQSSVLSHPEGNGLEGAIIASGAQDGTLCVWDVASGACVYSVSGHSGAVLSIVTSSSYLISLGADERLAVWERFQGHLLNTLHLSAGTFCASIIMLTSKLLITTRQGRLCVWDVSAGVQVLEVSLGGNGCSAMLFPRHLLAVGASVICDYGDTLRAVRMPVAEKME